MIRSSGDGYRVVQHDVGKLETVSMSVHKDFRKVSHNERLAIKNSLPGSDNRAVRTPTSCNPLVQVFGLSMFRALIRERVAGSAKTFHSTP